MPLHSASKNQMPTGVMSPVFTVAFCDVFPAVVFPVVLLPAVPLPAVLLPAAPFPVVPLPGVVVPVSYTHLDVYKRQDTGRSSDCISQRTSKLYGCITSFVSSINFPVNKVYLKGIALNHIMLVQCPFLF